MGLPGSPFPPMFGDPKAKKTTTTSASSKSSSKSEPALKPSASAGYLTTVRNGDPSSFDAKNDTQSLIGPLTLPRGLNAASQFTWAVNTDDSNNQDLRAGKTNASQTVGSNSHSQSLTTMTMAGAISYLKNAAVTSPDYYAGVVHQLVAAGFLSPSDAIYRGYSTKVGNAFLQSAAEVWSVNQDKGAGVTVRWQDVIDQRIQSRQESGIVDENGLPISGSGGSAGPQAPTRKDSYTNPDDVRAAVNSAAENLLGRKLTDSEVAQFQSAFRAQEKTANDQQWAQTMSQFNNQSSTPNTAPDLVNPPNASNSAQNYLDKAPAFGQEKSDTLLGSYIGVLRNMVGMGSGGVSHAVG